MFLIEILSRFVPDAPQLPSLPDARMQNARNMKKGGKNELGRFLSEEDKNNKKKYAKDKRKAQDMIKNVYYWLDISVIQWTYLILSSLKLIFTVKFNITHF